MACHCPRKSRGAIGAFNRTKNRGDKRGDGVANEKEPADNRRGVEEKKTFALMSAAAGARNSGCRATIHHFLLLLSLPGNLLPSPRLQDRRPRLSTAPPLSLSLFVRVLFTSYLSGSKNLRGGRVSGLWWSVNIDRYNESVLGKILFVFSSSVLR